MQDQILLIVSRLNEAHIFYPFVLVVGLVVGSFLNVVIYRLPKMMERDWYMQCIEFLIGIKNKGLREYDNIKFSDQRVEIHLSPHENGEPVPRFNLFLPTSSCPSCEHRIRPWQNIPVLSYLFLRGRCAKCDWPIPLRYPGIEILTALLSLVVAYYFGMTPQLLAALVFTWMLIALTFIDFDTQLLPDEITLLGVWLGLLISLKHVFVSPQDAILGAVAGYLILWSLYWVFKLLTHKEGMGYGDFKLMAMAGAWVGWQYLPVVVLIASFTGTIWGLANIMMRISHKDHPMPFGPFIALGAWLTLILGDRIVTTYLQWVQ